MSYCDRCGSKNKKNAPFCQGCGKPLQKNAREKDAENIRHQSIRFFIRERRKLILGIIITILICGLDLALYILSDGHFALLPHRTYTTHWGWR